MKISVVTVLVILAFAAIGASIPKLEMQLDSSKTYYTQQYGNTDAQIKTVTEFDLNNKMIEFGTIGAAFGLITGIMYDGFKSLKKQEL